MPILTVSQSSCQTKFESPRNPHSPMVNAVVIGRLAIRVLCATVCYKHCCSHHEKKLVAGHDWFSALFIEHVRKISRIAESKDAVSAENGCLIATGITLGGSNSVRRTDKPAPVGLTTRGCLGGIKQGVMGVIWLFERRTCYLTLYFYAVMKGQDSCCYLFANLVRPLMVVATAVRSGNACLGITAMKYICCQCTF
jgi:hypothetical protein